jgi:hypothetical protein
MSVRTEEAPKRVGSSKGKGKKQNGWTQGTTGEKQYEQSTIDQYVGGRQVDTFDGSGTGTQRGKASHSFNKEGSRTNAQAAQGLVEREPKSARRWQKRQ